MVLRLFLYFAITNIKKSLFKGVCIIYFKSMEGDYLCYNSRSNSFITFSEDLYKYISENKILNTNSFPNDLIKQLVSLKIFTKPNEDEDYLESLKLRNNIKIYSRHHLGLTLLPTTACNLRCPYCFEVNKGNKFMTDKIINDLIKFINQHEYAKTYSITWYGGEPLLAIDIINKISRRLKEDVSLKLLSQTMVTNGVSLNQKTLDILKDIPLNNIQFTFDGTPSTHDQKRFLPNKSGTFHLILNNIKRYMDSFPNRNVSIRINIDNHNKEEFYQVYDILCKELKEHINQIYIYPGIIKDENPNHSICNNHLMSSKDINDFYLKLPQHGVPVHYYPTLKDKGCTANNICGYVIGPEGEIYKCWVEVGEKNCIIGNIADNDFQNKGLFMQYLSTGNCFNDTKCLNCPILPICSGGCPNSRIQNFYNNKNNDICPIQQLDNNQGLKTFLQIHYQQKKQGYDK